MPANDSTMEISQLLLLQGDRMKTVKNMLRNLKKDTTSRKTKSYFDVRLQKLEKIYNEFHDDHKLLLFMAESDDDYFKLESATSFDDAYAEIHCALVDMCEELLGSSSSNNNGASQTASASQSQIRFLSSVQVPQIPLPSFSGQFIDWLPFYDAYVRLVHSNTELNPMQKFHLLKEAIPKDRDIDIHHMPLTEENFNSAWKLMGKRYRNPRVIFMHLMNGLYALPVQTKECSTQIKALLSAANVFVAGVKRWEVPIEECDHWLAHFLSTKLSRETHTAWERHLGSEREIPTYTQFESFLNDRLIELDAIENRNIGNPAYKTPSEPIKQNASYRPNDTRNQNKSWRNERKSVHTLTASTDTQKSEPCACCNSNAHTTGSCATYLAKDCFARKSFASKNRLCYNCLSRHHGISRCNSKRNCRICSHRHHTTLHVADRAATVTSSASFTPPTQSGAAIDTPQSSQASNVNAHNTHIVTAAAVKSPPSILLATALVKVVNPSTGRHMMVRALIDNGSEGTVVSENIVQSLGLKRKPLRTDISGVGDSKRSSSEAVSFVLRSFSEPDFSLFVDLALVLSSVTAHLPTQKITPLNWAHIHGLELADPTYFQPSEINLLIGVELAASILMPELKFGSPEEPIAQNSHFGWLLSGKAGSSRKSTVLHTAGESTSQLRCHHTSIENNAFESMVRNFFECEQIQQDRPLSQDEQWAVDFFKQTHIRKQNGKYQVRLPFKSYVDPKLSLGKSQQMALKRFYQTERKLNRNPEHHKRYSEGIQEYFDLNQIKRAFSTEEQHCSVTANNTPTITASVLPHHAVIKEESLTTKLRIVFDASAKTSNGRSLNDLLHIGPRLQNDLGGVIVNWRLHKYVFTSDIQKMYRCVDMHPEDSQYQRIWWHDENGTPCIYMLTTVTFGTASAPCTAILVLHQIAEDEKERFPLAESVLKHEIYVDDVQTGGDTIENTLEIRNQVIGALRSAGMELRKWASNDIRILEGIPPEHQSNSQALMLHNEDTIKILGMCWLPNVDGFKFKLKFDLPTAVTKRSILSTIARIYDPLGYIMPVLVSAKIIFKDVCVAGVGTDWDKPISSEIVERWHKFTSALPSINEIVVPRWIGYETGKVNSIQLHVFCDGSISAYATAVYIRIERHTGEIYTHLLTAKSRVTPRTPLTVPKIELNGAELAVRLAEWVKRQLRIHIDNIYFWSDATIVLYWIYGDVNRWKVYVANRINKIHQSTQPQQWSHVGTKDNPADCASRGLLPFQLGNFDLWWHGPQWLSQPASNWPKFDASNAKVDESSAEIKSHNVRIHVNIPQESIIFKYSSYQKLIRVNAWIHRFKINCLAKGKGADKRKGPLLVSELHQSLLKIVRLVQWDVFHSEMTLIEANEPLPKKNKLSGLAPFIKDDVLRVRGRLQRTNFAYQHKHPMIVPKLHHFTKLIIEDSHRRTLHGGAQLVLSHTRQQFWIVDGRRTVQTLLKKCVTCFKRKPEISSQLMGNLPYHRVNPPQRAFVATGIDYTGAFEVKASRFRGNTVYKAYVAIFICLASKAVHLEAVTGMQTKHFLWALQRFIGRRGFCHDIYSDNGTNFVGADRKLKGNTLPFEDGVANDIMPELSKSGIQWHFNPPHSPNFGGLWEANIRSMKHHLYRVLDNSHLTYEELATVLIRIEQMLNSRPLCPLTMDPDDLDMLTPGHFIIGDSLFSLPDKPDLEIALCENYIEMQQKLHQFWKRWSSEWLTHLQVRPKWHKVQPNLQVNDIVMIKDDRLKPCEWFIGRIVDIHPGMEGLVRVATIRTSKGLYKRSVSKLCRLPIPNDLNHNNNNKVDSNNSSSVTDQ